jgi:hypothetical protein
VADAKHDLPASKTMQLAPGALAKVRADRRERLGL